jgi:putative effector of murein hydrolase
MMMMNIIIIIIIIINIINIIVIAYKYYNLNGRKREELHHWLVAAVARRLYHGRNRCRNGGILPVITFAQRVSVATGKRTLNLKRRM